MRRTSLVLALLIAAAPAGAQHQSGFRWKLNDKDAPSDPSQATQDGFGVLMLVTSGPEAFLKAWAGSSPPQISTTEMVTREQPVHTMLIFSGCRAGPDGNCNVTAELGINAPDGSQYGEIQKVKVWSGPPGPEYSLQLAESSMSFILEPQDPLGTYTLRAVVTDNLAAVTLRVESAVIATATSR